MRMKQYTKRTKPRRIFRHSNDTTLLKLLDILETYSDDMSLEKEEFNDACMFAVEIMMEVLIRYPQLVFSIIPESHEYLEKKLNSEREIE